MARPKKTSHSSGLYRKRINIGTDPETGAPIRKAFYAKTKAELDRKIAQARLDMDAGMTAGKNSFAFWADAWKRMKYPTVGKTTQDMYNAALKHLAPLMPRKVSELRPIDLSNVVADMYAAGYSAHTIHVAISCARQICRTARLNGERCVDVGEEIHAPKDAPAQKREALTEQEQAALWSVVPPSLATEADRRRAERLPLIRMFSLMQLCCGLRAEEAAALRWDNVDLTTGTITVTEAWSFAEGRVKETKTAAGVRAIPIPARYLAELSQWHRNRVSSPYVFPCPVWIMTGSQFRGLWEILMDALNGVSVGEKISRGKKHLLPVQRYSFTSHQLRHTYASNAIAAGVDVRTLQYLLGHSTPAMSMHYTHATARSVEHARALLNSAV